MLSCLFASVLFPDFYEDERWTVGKHLLNNLFIFFFIAVGLWLYSDWIFGWGLRWDIFCSFLASTVVVGIFPTAFFVMLNRNRFLASHLQEAGNESISSEGGKYSKL